MTPDELKFTRLEMRVRALQVLLQSVVRGLAQGQPQALQAWKKSALEIAARKTIPGIHPAESDMLVAEFQEALRDLFDGL